MSGIGPAGGGVPVSGVPVSLVPASLVVASLVPPASLGGTPSGPAPVSLVVTASTYTVVVFVPVTANWTPSDCTGVTSLGTTTLIVFQALSVSAENGTHCAVQRQFAALPSCMSG